MIVKALYDYTKDEEDELSFSEGDEIIKLSEPSDEGKFFLKFTEQSLNPQRSKLN